ncbi:MAG: hypothetical protein Q8P67_03420, partial [archaeon]|nr:hypothetical protein [archaeon]
MEVNEPLGDMEEQKRQYYLPEFETEEQVLRDYGDKLVSTVPVFRPRMEEFRDFYGYVQAIERHAWAYGACKVVAPKEWREQPLTFEYGKHSDSWEI